MYKQISIDINRDQLKRAAKGKPISLTKAQVNGSGTKLYVHPENYKKIMKARKKLTGCRLCIANGEIEHDLKQGGSLWSWLKDKLFPALKPALSSALDAAVAPIASSLGQYGVVAPLGRQAIRSLTGVGVKKKLVKGSPEAKAHMAMIRSKRRGGSPRLY
jgi:hypothetical protein